MGPSRRNRVHLSWSAGPSPGHLHQVGLTCSFTTRSRRSADPQGWGAIISLPAVVSIWPCWPCLPISKRESQARQAPRILRGESEPEVI